MPTREQMHSLVQEITGGHEARAAGAAALRREVTTGRQVTDVWLREVTRERNSQTQQLRTDVAKTASHRRAGATGWLRAATRGRNTQTKQLRADLAKTAARRRAGVTAWLRAATRGRNTQTKQLWAELAQTAAQRRTGVIGWLRAAARGRKAQAQQVQTSLRQGRADLAEMDGQRRAGVAAWLLNVTRVHASAQREWQKLARGMHPRSTNGAAPAVETSTGQPKAVGEATHELTALAGGVFQYLADRPDGAPLVEIEKEIQLDRFGAVRALKRLMDDGKAEKRGRLYFAA
ncbi:MAG TPA: hypothetical protein VJM51_04310 [Dehalococcoidia bacterium]|nr:hypothetical protein [Dehalococcoidia bacterium]